MAKNLIIGLILIAAAVALAYNWQNTFFWTMVALIEGAIVPLLVFVGLVFLLIGIDELKAPAAAEAQKKKK